MDLQLGGGKRGLKLETKTAYFSTFGDGAEKWIEKVAFPKNAKTRTKPKNNFSGNTFWNQQLAKITV